MIVIMTEDEFFVAEGKPEVFGDTIVVSGRIIVRKYADEDMRKQFKLMTVIGKMAGIVQ